MQKTYKNTQKFSKTKVATAVVALLMPAVGMSQTLISGNGSFQAGFSSLEPVRVDDITNSPLKFSGYFSIKFTDVENNPDRDAAYALDIANGANVDIRPSLLDAEGNLVPVTILTTVKNGENGASHDVGGIMIGSKSTRSNNNPDNNNIKASVTGDILDIQAVSNGIAINNGILHLSNSTIKAGENGLVTEMTMEGTRRNPRRPDNYLNDIKLDTVTIEARDGISIDHESTIGINKVNVNAEDTALSISDGSKGEVSNSTFISKDTNDSAVIVSARGTHLDGSEKTAIEFNKTNIESNHNGLTVGTVESSKVVSLDHTVDVKFRDGSIIAGTEDVGVGSSGTAIKVFEPGSSLEVSNSSISLSALHKNNHVVEATNGGNVLLDNITVDYKFADQAASADSAMLLADTGAQITLKNSALKVEHDLAHALEVGDCYGFNCERDALIKLENSEVRVAGNNAAGAFLRQGGDLILDDSKLISEGNSKIAIYGVENPDPNRNNTQFSRVTLLNDSEVKADDTALKLINTTLNVDVKDSSISGKVLSDVSYLNPNDVTATNPGRYYSDSEPVLNLNADNAKLEGAALTKGFGFDMQAMTPIQAQSHFNFKNGTAWNMTGNSEITTLDNQNSTVSFAKPKDDNDFKILTVTGVMKGDNGVVELWTEFEDDTSKSDKIVLLGPDAKAEEGNALRIKQYSGEGAQTNVGILVVDTAEGGTTAINAFTLDKGSDGYRDVKEGHIAKGAYNYYLVRGGNGGIEDNWYLTSKHTVPLTPLEPSTPIEKPEEPGTSIPWTPLEPSTPIEKPEEPGTSIPWTPLEPSTPIEKPEEPGTSIPWTPLEPSTPIEKPEEPGTSIPWTPLEPATPIEKPTRPEVGAYFENRRMAMTMTHHKWEDRRAEMGDLDGNAWIRLDYNHGKYNPVYQTKRKIDIYRAHFGRDLYRHEYDNGSRLDFGVMGLIGMGHSKTHYGGITAKGDVTSYNIGIYGTWQQHPDTKLGTYIDVWTMFGWNKSEVKGDGLAKETIRPKTFTVSAEIGRAVEVDRGEDYTVYLQPQAQLIWSQYRVKDHTENTKTVVSGMRSSDFYFRFGMRLYADMVTESGKHYQPFFDVNYWRSPSRHSMTFNRDYVTEINPGRGKVFDLSLGVKRHFDNDSEGWLRVGYKFGSEKYRDVNVNVGYTHHFR